ncbi:MAG: ABC transporter permease, partial [Lachnospiraceae bacterium]|nr:ABC transporter permease [Lachnospiraceae bacterium]
FKKYLEDEYKKDGSVINTALNGISYSYNINMPIYTKNVDGEILLSDVQALMSDIYVQNMGLSSSAASEVLNASGSNPMFRLAGNGMRMWQELLPGLNGESVNDVLKKQYDVVYGEWPNDYNEVVLVLNKYNELDDITLYALGLVEKEHIDAITKSAMDNEGNKAERLTKTWTYEEICSQTYRLVLPSSCYVYDEEKQVYTDLRETDTGLNFLYDNAVPLKVTGIIRPNEDANSNMLSGSIAYTSKLTEYVIEENGKSSAIKDQLADENVDIFNGFTFKSATEGYTDDEKAAKTDEYINGLTDETKLMLYTRLMSIPSDEELANMTKQGMEGLDRKAMEGLLKEAMTSQMGMSESQVEEYLSSMSDEDMTSYTEKVISEKAKADYAAGVMARFQAMSPVELKAGADAYFDGLSLEEKAKIFEDVIELSDSTLEENLEKLGYVFLDDPATVNIYANSFENKDKIEDAIASYNEGREELEKIEYTDYVGLIMSSVTTIVNAITYVLIAFVAISLVVSSIMIGVITLISVQERTKEIGILRALGASKKNVSSLFNAETVIIGFASGLIGVGITILLCFPINSIIHNLTGIESLNAYLPPLAGVILVGISVFLTLISGIIPSRSAAKKDPVVALRTE